MKAARSREIAALKEIVSMLAWAEVIESKAKVATDLEDVAQVKLQVPSLHSQTCSNTWINRTGVGSIKIHASPTKGG